jgi:hypothetical protein
MRSSVAMSTNQLRQSDQSKEHEFSKLAMEQQISFKMSHVDVLQRSPSSRTTPLHDKPAERSH